MKFQSISKILYSIVLLTLILETRVESTHWKNLINKTHKWSQSLSQEFQTKFLQLSQSKKISIACNASVWQTLNGFKNLDVWAFEMFNSWGSFPPNGVLVGTSTDFGSYDQCLAIQPNSMIEKPQYCLIDVRPPVPKPMPVHHNLHHRLDVLPIGFSSDNNSLDNAFQTYSEFASFFYWLSLRTGICTPSKCTPEDISLLAQGFADNYGLEYQQSSCETKPTKTTLNNTQIAAILFIFTVLLISMTATVWERFRTNKQTAADGPQLFIDLFSIKQNIECLFTERSSEVFPCIHGIRVLTLFWVIFSHSTEWTNFQLFSRAFRVKTLFARIDSQLTLNGEYAVENFFFIGGMLTSFITFQYTRGQLSRFSVIGFLLSRFLRLTPQLFIFILLTFLLPLGGWASGPIWKETIDPILENCSNNWWWNIFYIQNWFTASKICALHSWYLACDMQYHWVSLLLVIPILYKQKLGLIVTCFTIIAFYLTSNIISYSYDLPPGLINTGRDEYFLQYYIDLFYIKPWSHSTVFFIGFLFGIIAYNKKFKKLNKKTKYLVILLIILGYFTCLMDTYYWNTGKPHDRLISALVFSTCRVIWSLSTAALIWLCISGNGGRINDYLSAKIFIPLSRLTYSVYLTHVWIIWIFVGSRRERIDTEWTEIFFIFIHNLIISYLVGFLFALLFETPIIKLQKRLIKRCLDSIDNKENMTELTIKLNTNPVIIDDLAL